MPASRILIVDDSVVVRTLVSKLIEAEPELEHAGSAANGRLALESIARDRPDLVILDLEMPVLGGLETLELLRREWPDLPVIVFSTLTRHGAGAALEALSRGASDYVTKPSRSGDQADAIETMRLALVPRIRALLARRRPAPAASGGRAIRAAETSGDVDAVVIGVSTGGPAALAELMPRLPAELAAPLLIVQHMPRTFTELFASRLDRNCALKVAEATHGAAVRGGEAWIAQGGRHLVLHRNGDELVLGLSTAPPENSCRPAADVLFRSASRVLGPRCLGVILTGMGCDGAAGGRAIRDAGGDVVVQDEASSVVWGMPGEAVRRGVTDCVLSLPQIAEIICRRAGSAPLVGTAPGALGGKRE